ncbi:hypothetical protein TI39_contig4159g00041 [Zymoseptoria brevis]|uniref:Extracellular membrane protein CFEM domain-containing protein n=1 Tax=Zymoseptoria brevis TaxID=1047168 RepID=A0A0F4GCP4_9PEZI|nr:hypothetical protein TI39_contig4159g00041 [Zymoseptoria brevis]
MHFASPILFLAALLPAIVVAENAYGGTAFPHTGSLSKRNDHPLLSRRYVPGQTCSAGDDLSCCFEGTTEKKQPSTCPIPLTNDPAKPAVDCIRRDGYGYCDDGTCSCSVMDMTYAQLMVICTDLISRLDTTHALTVVDACYHEGQAYCTTWGPSTPSFPGTDVHGQPGRFCYNFVYRDPNDGN